ncbi:hypothetical protein [Yeosuana marina]|uniref:hypothetical protein n=1 Tax=Yeosuana marina TaxID=1565536 RepID=UPI0030C86A0D
MKNFKLILNLTIVVTSFMFFQCTSEYTPIAGADGKDGIDGVDGVDGADTSAEACIACHSNSHRDPIYTAYNLSVHATETMMYTGQTVSEYTNRTGCVECHTSSGFIDYTEYGFTAEGNPAYQGKQTITCTTCHSSHRSFDFENDGNDFALRTLDPVALVIDPTITIDMTNDSDPIGASNLCVSCHQPRTAYPTPDADGNFAVTSSHWGPHHGPQSTLLKGLGGALLAGTTDYPGVGTAGHAQGASCVSCHMGEPTAGDNGGHTWNPTDNACLTCHTSGVPTEVAGLQEDMDTLLGLLETEGVLTAEGEPVPGTYNVKVAQAAFNYLFLQEDKSKGIHNPKYAKALIKNSIENLQP